MYDVYWYSQMKKNKWLWKFWKRNDLYENFEKREVVEKWGGGRNPCPMRPCAWDHNYCNKSLFTVFFLIITTALSRCSQFLSYHNYSYASLFTVLLFPSQLQLEVTIHSFFLITTIAWSHYSQFFSRHNYNLKSLLRL
jgi:hypothetical protein